MTATERVVVKELSSSLLDMKFMLKKKKQIEAKEAKRKSAIMDQKIAEKETEPTCSTDIPKTLEAKSEFCNDLAKLEGLHFGRLSFGGFNKEVETLMVHYERLRNGELSDDEDDYEKDVKDDEMAQTFGGGKLAALSKKMQSKKERRQHNERNQESVGQRHNFKDPRKRAANDDEIIGQPQRKFMRPADD